MVKGETFKRNPGAIFSHKVVGKLSEWQEEVGEAGRKQQLEEYGHSTGKWD